MFLLLLLPSSRSKNVEAEKREIYSGQPFSCKNATRGLREAPIFTCRLYIFFPSLSLSVERSRFCANTHFSKNDAAVNLSFAATMLTFLARIS